ncbi:hypothetical protein [Serratia sp. (in: enterobacteria)]|uniref:hypothetical protein n=1 Tax=Serratia sp. (in: enterobacteria) TaxID=616 RepID=UPI00398A1E48
MSMGKESFETMREIGMGFLLAMVKVWDARGFDPVATYYAAKKMETIFFEILRGMCPPEKHAQFESMMQELDDMMLHEKEDFKMREQIEAMVKKIGKRGSL